MRWPTCLLSLGLLACTADRDAPAGRFAAMGAITAEDSTLLLIGGATSTGSSGPLQEAWRFGRDDLSWTQAPDPPEALCRGTAVRVGEQVHVFGGSTTGWDDVAWSWTWDLEEDTWRENAGVGPEARFKHAAVAWDGRVVVVGGRNNDGDEDVFFGDVWSWDRDTDTWTEIATSGGPAGIHRHELVADPGRGVIWVHAGFQPPREDEAAEPERSDRLWQLDPNTGSWTEESWSGDAPPIRASHTLQLVGGELLTWGGNASDESAWSYDPDTATWTKHASSPAPLARDSMVTALTSDGASLVLAGGDPVSEDVPNFVMDVWELDVASMAWSEVVGIE